MFAELTNPIGVPLLIAQGRLVPRQPWAIKRTTRTELRGENIRYGGFIHGNAGIKSTTLRINDKSIGLC